MPDYSYRCRPCHTRFTVAYASVNEFVFASSPACPQCSSTSVCRHVPIDFINEVATQLTNAKSKADGNYPYPSLRLRKNMPGCRVADGKSRVGNCQFIPGKGTTIIDSPQHEREVMSGGANGERYARE